MVGVERMAVLREDPFKWLSLNQLRADPPPEVKFLWGDKDNGLLQERSFMMLHSAEKQGKSMFGLNLAIAGARSDASYLDIVLRPGGFRTLILQCEVHMRAMYERFQTMLRNGDLTNEQAENILINGYRAVTLSTPGLFWWFRRKIRQFKPDLIIVDPLAHMLTEDENSNVAVGRALAPLLKLRDDPGSAIIVIHHDSKLSEGTAGRPAHQRSRGANRLTADPDSIVSMIPAKRCGGPTAKLACIARYGRSMVPFRIRLNEDNFWFERYSVEREQGEQLQAILRDAGGRLAEADLIREAGEKWNLHDEQHDHRTVRKRIVRAVSDEMIFKLDLQAGVFYEATMPIQEA